MMYESAKKILVIEDDTTTRKIFLEGLAAEGYETISAENGLVGIQQAQKHLPDLIICDIKMPDMDGYGVIEELRQDPLTAIIPFIFLTGSDSRAEIRRGMELGADDYLIKPATVEQLLTAIETRLQKQDTMRRWFATNCHKISASLTPPSTPISTNDSIFPSLPQFKEVFDFIEANYHKGITLCDVADAVGYSSAYLTNRVAKQTGEGVNGWIVKRRMSAARTLLRDTDETIADIATALGYQNACHFSRQFRQHHGVPPQAWRKEYLLLQTSINERLQHSAS